MYHILLFDGKCRYCNRWVQWVVDRDKNRCFRFASLQSNFAEELFRYNHLSKDFDSIAILKIKPSNHSVFILKSEAVVFLFSKLNPDAILYKFIKLMPRFLSDFGYDCIAAVRRFLPVADCRLYSDEEKRLFLDDSNFNEWLFRFRDKK